jgi:glutamine synthetase
MMDKVARRHHFKVLLHEKPYAGINGSGKHNNWSLGTNTGKNLLSPGSTPKSNLMFLTFFINTIQAVFQHADLLRASIASASNDHRLGANEAPPAIMSIFLGGQLSRVLDEIVQSVHDKKMSPDEKTALKLNIGKIPEILLDNTDRNRTSPFAFTGNKFEFRAVGSSANCSNPMMVLNTMVANQLTLFKAEVDALIEKGTKKDEAILKVLRQYIVESANIRFEGNGYGEEWTKEAKKRGLSNFQTSPVAMDAYVSKSTLKLFSDMSIFNHREAEARHEIMLETYIKKIQIESRVMGDLVINHILPAALKYQTQLAQNVQALSEIKVAAENYSSQLEMIKVVSNHMNTIRTKIAEMIDARKKANKIENVREKAIAYCDIVKPFLDIIRDHVDDLEMIVDDELWPMAKYRELVTIR